MSVLPGPRVPSALGLVASNLALLLPGMSPLGILWSEALRVQASLSSSCKMAGTQRTKVH